MSVIRTFIFFLKITSFATVVMASQTGLSASKGQKQYEELLKRTPLFKNAELTSYIESLGAQVVSVSEMAGEKFIFSLLDDPALNAFATADNFVYINRGLLNYVSNEAQLVSVIAHEVAHVTRGHINKQVKSGTATQVLSTVAAMLANTALRIAFNGNHRFVICLPNPPFNKAPMMTDEEGRRRFFL